MRVVIVALGLIAAAALAAALAIRAQRPSAIELALGEDVQPGMSVAEVTAVLRRLNVAFTVDSTTEGATIVKYGRQAVRSGRTSGLTDQHLVFDAEGRLRRRLTATQITMP